MGLTKSVAKRVIREQIEGAERGALLAFIGQLAETDFDAMEVEECDGPAAIVGYLRAQPSPVSGPSSGVTVYVEVFDAELGYHAESKITLQDSDEGQRQLQGYMRQWHAWGLWDKVTLGESGVPYIVNKVKDLQDGARYMAYGSNTKGVKRLDRQLQNTGKKHEPELENALVEEVNASGHTDVEGRPDLHVLNSKLCNMELDAVAVGEKTAYIAEHEERAALTKDNTFAVVEVVYEKARLVEHTLANSPTCADSKFAAFKGRQITPAVMYEYVDPKLQPALELACKRKGVMLFARNGTSISRVPAVKPMASLGNRRVVTSVTARLL